MTVVHCDPCGKPVCFTRGEGDAECARILRRDPGAHLEVFPCRVMPGWWHVGNSSGPATVRGLPWERCRLLRVSARLRHGAALTGLFPAPLDGILASVVRRRRLGPDFDPTVIDRHVERLPLCTSYRGIPAERPDLGRKWVWAATCAQFPDGTPEDVRWFHKRFRDRQAELVVGKLPANTDVGRFKPWRLPLVVTVAAELTWWAVGDPDQVRDLVADVHQVGKKRSQGEGVVIGWEVADAGPPDWGPVMWQQGRIARPVPARAAASLGVPGADVVAEQYRPPYFWAPAGEDGRPETDRSVIAPWTAQPQHRVA